MAFDVQTLASAATCAECLNASQKQDVALYLLNEILLNGGSGGGGSGGVHDLLSTAHLDTLPAAVVRGSLIAGNSTPKWSELLIGAAGTVLTSDGTDVSWATPASAGTVTSFSAGNLAPLFTTSVATASTTPALTFSLSTQSANLIFAGPASGAAVGPTFRSLVALDLPATAVAPAIYGSATQVGQFTVDQQGRITLAANVAITYPGSFSGFADPSALVGLSAIAGVATTAMRSDGAPALDQAIVPTWTGTHTFTASATIIGSAANALNAIQIVPPAASGSNMVDLFSDGGPGYNAIRKYFSSPFQVEISSSGSIDFVIDSNGNETGATVKFLTNALRGGVQTTLFTFFDNGTLVCSPTLGGAIQLNPFGVAAGNTSEIRYLELAANGTNYTGFKAPDALAASEMYVLPDAAPSANRFLRAGAVSGGVSTLSWAQASLTADVTGTLPVGNGGTGLTSGTSGGILGFTAATTLASSVLLTTNALILGGGAGATPVPMASLGTATTVLHGNAAGAPTFGAVVLTADVSGILPVANGGSGTSTAFTAGSVIFAGAAGVFAQDNANLFYDDSANRLTVNQIGIPNTTSATVGGIFFGGSRMFHNFGTSNTSIGQDSGNFTMTGNNNTFFGVSCGKMNTTGISNSFFGVNSGRVNTTGSFNTFFGESAGVVNTAGDGNSFFGVYSGLANTTGGNNTFYGIFSGMGNTTGNNNTLFGYSAGDNITVGNNNLIIGNDIDAPVGTNSNQLSIGNLIFGTAIDGTGVALSSGNIGIGVITPLAKFHVTNSAAATVACIIKAAAAQSANLTCWQDSSAVILTKVNSAGNVGVRMAATALTAYLHIAAGTTAASTAPIKLTTGTSMTAAEAGAVEFTTDDLFFTITTGAARKRLLMADPVGGLTATRVPFATTNGRLTDDAGMTFGSSLLTVPNLTVVAAGVLQLGNAAVVGAALVSTHTLTIKDSGGTTYRIMCLV